MLDTLGNVSDPFKSDLFQLQGVVMLVVMEVSEIEGQPCTLIEPRFLSEPPREVQIELFPDLARKLLSSPDCLDNLGYRLPVARKDFDGRPPGTSIGFPLPGSGLEIALLPGLTRGFVLLAFCEPHHSGHPTVKSLGTCRWVPSRLCGVLGSISDMSVHSNAASTEVLNHRMTRHLRLFYVGDSLLGSYRLEII